MLNLLEQWMSTGVLLRNKVSFGIVTPFRLQMETIQNAIRDRPWWEQVKARVTVGTVHKFQGDERDIMIFSPVVADGMSEKLVHWVANNDQLLNVALTRARGALHIVGDRDICGSSEGYLARFAAAVRESYGSNSPTESPAEARMAELLDEAKLWYVPQHNVGRHRLDFLVITPFGTRYDIEVDGRGHRATEAVRSDEIRDAAVKALGLKVLRIDAWRIFKQETAIRELLRRLV